MTEKRKTTCESCGYRWPTRTYPPSDAVCPKCKYNPPAMREVLAKLGLVYPKPDPGPEYGRSDCDRFVRYLGCWSFVNPVNAVHRRDPAEYVGLLKQLIAVNKTRQDNFGRWETLAALSELRRLSDEDPDLRTLILADRPPRLHDRRATLPGSTSV